MNLVSIRSAVPSYSEVYSDNLVGMFTEWKNASNLSIPAVAFSSKVHV